MNWAKAYVAKETNHRAAHAAASPRCCKGADVFIGLSTGNIVTEDMVRSMAPDPIVFALAVPEPEIDPDEARAGRRASGRHRPLRLPEHDGHLARLPRRLPRAARFARPQHPPAHAALRRPALWPTCVQPDELHADHIVPRSSTSGSPRPIAAAVVAAAIEARRGRARCRARAGGRAHPPLRLRRAAPNVSRQRAPRASSTRPSAKRRSTCASATAACWRSSSKIPIRDHHILNMLYVPPAALAPAHVIRDDPSQVDELTAKGNLVAIVTDGSAVLGLGDIGPQAALPVMEGKAVLFRRWPGSRRSRSASPRAIPTRSSRSSRTSPRTSAASTWKTSPRRAASRSSASCASARHARSSTTISTAPRSSSRPR